MMLLRTALVCSCALLLAAQAHSPPPPVAILFGDLPAGGEGSVTLSTEDTGPFDVIIYVAGQVQKTVDWDPDDNGGVKTCTIDLSNANEGDVVAVSVTHSPTGATSGYNSKDVQAP